MHRILIIILVGFAGFAGMVSSAFAGLFSSSGPVIAIYAGDLFLGIAIGNFDGSGTIQIQSRSKPDVTCVGQFTSSAKLGGVGDLKCSDNSSAVIKFQRLSMRRGYGTGNSSRGQMSFTYGLNVNESSPYLKLPKGKALSMHGQDVELVDEIHPISPIIPILVPSSSVPENAPDQIQTQPH
jgi:hypothetical protein